MEQSKEDELLKLTSSYRREASALMMSSSLRGGGSGKSSHPAEKVAASVQQSLGWNALDESTPELATLGIPSSFQYCHACGKLLEPGVANTTVRLRSVGRAKTRRRRASRLKAAAFRIKKQLSISGGRRWKQDGPQDDDINREERDLMRVTDGMCRNMVVVTCGSCGYKLKYKGLPPLHQKAMGKPISMNPVVQKTSSTKEGLGDRDVISLPRESPEIKSTSKRTKRKGTISMIDKSKKKAKGSGSGLMDFLSSLNDS